jgi:glycosyltransferase involved in cell wall biosynthesis
MELSKKNALAFVCFYEASIGGHGAAEVSLSLFESINNKNKKFFEIKKNFIFKLLEKFHLNIFEQAYKIFASIRLSLEIIKFLKNYYNKIVIIEGASWAGYSYLTIKFIKFFSKDIIIIYHAHNIEYYLRKNKKSFFLINYLTKILEKKIFNVVDIGTVVSKKDQKIVKNIYNVRTHIFNNGINKKRLKIKKISYEFPKNFLIYSGSYSFFPNKIAIDKLIYKIFPELIKKYPNIKLVITGSDFPVNKFEKYTFIKYFKNLNKGELNFLINKSKFLLAPMSKGPGTKLKIIEALMLGCIVVSTNQGFSGLKLKIKNKYFFKFSNHINMFKLIDYVIKNNKLIRTIAKNNKKYYINEYLMENILKKFLNEIYKKKRIKL